MKISKGSKRVVITLPSFGIVIKFPVIRVFETILTIFSCLKKRHWIFLKIFLKARGDSTGVESFRKYIFEGVLENWREYVFFQKNGNTLLQPTYFSFFGFMNIQKLGQKINLEPKETEIDRKWKFRRKLEKILGDDFYKDSHHFSNPENFSWVNDKIQMHDYGGLKCQEVIKIHGAKIHATFDVHLYFDVLA